MSLRLILVTAFAVILMAGVLGGCSAPSNLPPTDESAFTNPVVIADDELVRESQYVFPPHCGITVIKRLYAGQTIHVGWVAVWTEVDGIHVHYQTKPEWLMDETHFAIATSLEGIPHNKSGNPKIGQFPYSDAWAPPVNDVEYVVGVGDYYPEQQLYLAAHAAVHRVDANGQIVQQETAWGDGCCEGDSKGGSWAMFFTYNVQVCD